MYKQTSTIEVVVLVVLLTIGIGVGFYKYGEHEGYKRGYATGKGETLETLRAKNEPKINDTIQSAYSSGCNYGASSALEAYRIEHDGYAVLKGCNQDSIGANPYYHLTQ